MNLAARILKRAYDWASGSPRVSTWATQYAPARQALAARHALASGAAYHIANTPTAEAIASVWVTNAVGDGPSVRSGHPDEAMRNALEDAWAGFYDRADVEGLCDLGGLLARVMRSTVSSGEALAHMLTTQRGELRVRLLSPEQLDPALNRDDLNGGPRIVAGVEFNAIGERIAYHLFPEQPDLVVSMLAPPVRVPAEDVLHIFEPRVPGQVRGISWLAPVMTRLHALATLEDSLGARYNTAALFAGFITDTEGGGGGFTDGAKVDPASLSLEPGVMRLLPPGTDVRFPDVPGIEGAPDFLKHCLRAIASGAGVPYELLTGNLADVNYSSAKLGLEQFKRRCRAVRSSLLVAQFLRPMWQRFVTLEILSGRLHAPDFARDPEPYLRATFLFPEWAALDPQKETGADIAALGAGLRSRAEIIASRGRDIADVDAEIAIRHLPPGRTTGRADHRSTKCSRLNC